MASIKKIIDKIETTAALFKTKPSVVSAKLGQGGRFHARLSEGKQAWPSTLDAVDSKLDAMRALGTLDLPDNWCDISHDHGKASIQGQAPKEGAA
jgi:hypothetical protein